jgi:hypothetical protein
MASAYHPPASKYEWPEENSEVFIVPGVNRPRTRYERVGHCVGKLADGSVCGVAFLGPPNRRFCDEHSHTIRYRGRGM